MDLPVRGGNLAIGRGFEGNAANGDSQYGR